VPEGSTRSPYASAGGEDLRPLERAERRQIEKMLEEMSLRELIGQRFLIYVPGQSVTAELERVIRTAHPAGFILYPWNYETRRDVRLLSSELRETARRYQPGMDLLLCADQEGGRVAAFRFDSLVRLPSAHAMGRYENPRFVRSAGYISGVQLRSMGLDMNLAPVLDVYGKADSTIIGDRSFGGDPETVARLGTAFAEGLRSAGIIAVGKHFPGHGVTTVDSHGRLPVSSIKPRRLRQRHLLPFKRAVENGIDAMMTAHVLYPRLDKAYPATLSPYFVRKLLRRRLGFEGVVISDGVEMGALTEEFSKREILEHALTNGVDLLLLYARYDLRNVVSVVEQLVAEGRVTRADLRRGVRRVLELKARYGLLPAIR
jgi:beta-N-acetylhexosaminidase